MRNIVILISGQGSNMEAIVGAAERDNWEDRLGARVAAVISNKADAPGLQFARNHGIATAVVAHADFATRDAFDAALAQAIAPYDTPAQPALVVLAGFMRILTPGFVAQFAGRLVNIHPSLLPAFPGLNTHQRALDAGCTMAGATVHMVTEELDHGHILDQVLVPISPCDSAQTLSAKVLAQEHVLYPRALVRLLSQGAV